MIELDCDNVVAYLCDVGLLTEGEHARAEWLTWGVSNVVLRLIREDGPDVVVKQSREQLRTKADWFSRLDRIYREADVLQILGGILPVGTIPRLLFEDRDNYVFVMEAIAADHRVWKADLLNGRVDLRMAEILAHHLSAIHVQTREIASTYPHLADCEVFDQLRIDPFYRFVANRCPDLGPAIGQLIEQTEKVNQCLVLADFSPKNILITQESNDDIPLVTLVDFETGHFGDPAFDLGFFLSHLLLKTVQHSAFPGPMLELARSFWQKYLTGLSLSDQTETSALNRRTVAHLAGCMLARIDGKSTVDYLTVEQQDCVREVGRVLLLTPVVDVEQAFDQLAEMINYNHS